MALTIQEVEVFGTFWPLCCSGIIAHYDKIVKWMSTRGRTCVGVIKKKVIKSLIIVLFLLTALERNKSWTTNKSEAPSSH